MRIIAWNIRRASATSAAWRIFACLDPDLALLQEVTDIPASVKESFGIKTCTAAGRLGAPQSFGTAVLTKGDIIGDGVLHSEYPWVNCQIESFRGNLVPSVVRLGGYPKLNVVSVHSPAWPLDVSAYEGFDVTTVKLQESKGIWVADILWSGLRNVSSDAELWVVGGDLNTSETLDQTFGSGNREYLERMRSLGLTECLRKYNGRITPTFHNPRDGKVIHQIDHLFVSDALYSRLISCITGDADVVFGESISDHLPIIADFEDQTRSSSALQG